MSNVETNDYLYGGKELQQRFGVNLYDSGARFQSNTGAFTSPDPLAEKYYSISPYAYCAGNPVNLVDPEGREIWIILDYDKKTGIVKEAVQYKDGKLYTKGGDEYKGENSFANRILGVLHDLTNSENKESQQVLNKLETSKNKHRFYSLKGERKTMPEGDCGKSLANSGEPTGSYILYDIDKNEKDGGVELTAETSIVHELYHAYDLDSGNMKGEYEDKFSPAASDPAEIRAVIFENIYRKRHGLPKRTYYGGKRIKSSLLK